MPRISGSRTRRDGAVPPGRHHSHRAGTGSRAAPAVLAGDDGISERYVAAGAGNAGRAGRSRRRADGDPGEPQVVTPTIRRAWPAMVFTLLALAAVLLVLLFNGSVSAKPTPFDVGVVPSSQPVHAGNAASYRVTITAHRNYHGQLMLATSTMPAGITAGFSQTTPTLTRDAPTVSVTVTLTAGGTATPGPEVIAITAGDGRSTASADLILQVVTSARG